MFEFLIPPPKKKKEKEQFKQEQLYIEAPMPKIQKKEKPKKEDDSGISVIELF